MSIFLSFKKIASPIKNHLMFRKYFIYPTLFLIAIIFISCSESATTEAAAPAAEEAAAPAAEEAAAPAAEEAAAPAAEEAEAAAPAAEEAEAAAPAAEEAPIPEPTETSKTITTKSIQSKDLQQNQFDEYLVVLAADENMTLPGVPGELRIWIGNPSYQPNIPDDMVDVNTTIPALGGWAKIEPHAKAFKIDPPITQCVEIAPSGSEIPFKLIPLKTGTFKVGASVWLFKSSDCKDSPIPKIATNLYVTVNVDRDEINIEKIKELWTIFWEQLLKFWKAFLVLLFGLILFLIRDRLKRWFGYEKN